ncbi:MAG: TonB family protein [Chitinophagales bacterium]|nr:TonB family protein [Chitinophagales bacterium]
MKILLLIISLVFLDIESYSQDSIQIYQPTELHASFPGGNDSLKYFIRKNIKIPQILQQFTFSGKVIVKFSIDENGLLNDIIVVKNTLGSDEVSQEAIRLVKNMPKWIPAYLDGKPVKSFYTLPITFGNIE